MFLQNQWVSLEITDENSIYILITSHPYGILRSRDVRNQNARWQCHRAFRQAARPSSRQKGVDCVVDEAGDRDVCRRLQVVHNTARRPEARHSALCAAGQRKTSQRESVGEANLVWRRLVVSQIHWNRHLSARSRVKRLL